MKLSWCWQTRATCLGSVKVTKHSTIRFVRHGFVLVCYSNFVRKTHHFWDIRLQKYRDLENRVRGPSRSLEMSPFDKAHMTSYWRSVVGSISYRFWDIQCRKISWPWNPSQRSLKVIGTDTYRSATYNFLLTFHGPISHRFRDRRQFQSKIANFPNPLCI